MNFVGECVGRDPAGAVAAARREGAPVDPYARRDRLQRVVRPGEQREVRSRRRARPVELELREPEAVQVRLVPDDDVPDSGDRPYERGRVGGELAARLVRQRRRARAGMHDRHVDAYAVSRRGLGDVLEDAELGLGGSRLTGLPEARHAYRPEARRPGRAPCALRPRRARTAARRPRLPPRSGPDRPRRRQAPPGREGLRRPSGGLDAWGYASEGMRENLEGTLAGLPRKPGVYVFRDEQGDALYVGKAKSLRPRVRSYFQRSDGRVAIAQLAGRIADVEVIVTRNEAEALHLEQNLVKRYRPPFNIRLRDDKSFPYIAVTLTDEFPRVMFTRERHRRGTVYFGPYANAKKVRETLDVLNRVFKFRPCEGPRPGRHSGIPCLDFHIDRCFAPCVNEISAEDYGEIIEGVIGFLSGDTLPIQRELEARMEEAARDERFEEAARYRNRLFAIRHLAERQATDKRAVGTVDVIGAGCRGRPRRGAGLPAARRADDRPLRLPPRERRRGGRAVRARGVRGRVLRATPEHPASGAGARRDAGNGGDRRVPVAAARVARRGAGARTRERSAASSSWRPRTLASRWKPTRRRARPSGYAASPRSSSCASA